MKNIKYLLLFISVIFLVSCKSSPEVSLDPIPSIPDPSVLINNPTPIVNYSSGTTSPSMNRFPKFDITNLPFSSGYIYVYSGYGCTSTSMPLGVTGEVAQVNSSLVRLNITLTNPGQYYFSTRFETSSNSSNCTNFSYNYLTPSTPPLPSSISVTSSGFDPTPSVSITGLREYTNISIFSDSSCTTLVGSKDLGSLTNTTFSLNTLPTIGTYTLYAKAIDGSISSSCSGALASYNYTLPPTPTALTISGPSYNTTPQVTVSGTSPGLTVKVFKDASCSQLIGSANSYSTSSSFNLQTLSAGQTYSLYAHTSNGVFDSSCSSQLASYQLESPPVPSAITINSTVYDRTPDATISGIANSLTVNVYTDSNCSTLVGSKASSSTSVTLTLNGLIVGNSYNLYAKSTNGVESSACSSMLASFLLDFPPIPSGITLSTPGYDATPSVTVTGLGTGLESNIYTDSNCTTLVGSSSIFSESFTFNLSALSIGTTHSLYAKSTNGSDYSACSGVLATYQLDYYPAPTFSKISPTSSSGISNIVELHASNILSNDQITYYSDNSCTTVISATETSNGTSLSVFSNALTEGSYNFYAIRKNTSTSSESQCVDTMLSYQVTSNNLNTFGISSKGTAHVSFGSHPIQSGDFNNDGNKDLAYMDGYGLNILLGDGAGNFTTSTLSSMCNSSGGCQLTIGDLNNDNYDDISYASVSGQLYIVLSKGDGRFEAKVSVHINSNYSRPFVNTSDINLDGVLDIIVSDHTFVEVHIGNGDGTFQNVVNYSTTTTYPMSSSSVLTDLNSDIYPDLVMSDAESDKIIVLLNNGDGTFSSEVSYPAGDYPTSIQAVDIDGDNDQDIILVNLFDATIGIFRNNGNGVMGAQSTISLHSKSKFITVGDINGDNNIDIVSSINSEGQMAIFYGAGDGSVSNSFYISLDGAKPNSVHLLDMDNDGDLDIATAVTNSSGIQLITNQ